MSAAAAIVSSAPEPAGTSLEDDGIDLTGLDRNGLRAVDWLLSPARRFPALPSAVADVMAVANTREANFREVDRVVRADPVLAARVLSVANSPLYRPPAPITSLRMALMRLGWSILREVLLQAVAEAHLFRGGPRREVNAVRLHSIAIAHVHRHVAQVLGFDTEHAFVCGLLHDLGRPALLTALAASDAPPLDPTQRDLVIRALHPMIGARTSRAWQLPDVVARVCLDHHRSDDGGAALSQGGVSSVALCEALVASEGYASEPVCSAEQAATLLARVQLPPHELESLRSTALVLCREAS